MVDFVDLELARRYHGHLGSNLVIGIKLGNYAVDRLDGKRHFGLRAEVHCPAQPPVSCMIDGIQLSTGCTMGKKNIVHVVSDDRPKLVVTNTETGESITLRPADGLIDKAMRWYKELGEDDASFRVWQMKDDEVIEECRE